MISRALDLKRTSLTMELIQTSAFERPRKVPECQANQRTPGNPVSRRSMGTELLPIRVIGIRPECPDYRGEEGAEKREIRNDSMAMY